MMPMCEVSMQYKPRTLHILNVLDQTNQNVAVSHIVTLLPSGLNIFYCQIAEQNWKSSKRALRFLCNDHSISYEGLFEKAGEVKMSVHR